MTDEAVLLHMGKRVRELRLRRDLTQAELAQECGVGKSTIERFERGASVQFTNVIRILRILGKLEGLLELVPDQNNSPMQMLAKEQAVKYRASRKRHKEDKGNQVWEWGDK